VGTASRVWLSLAGFLLIAGVVYLITSHEYAGALLLLIGGVTFSYLSLVGRSVVRRAEKDTASSDADGEEEVHIPPTIWPFAFSVAGLIIAVGLIVSPWILAIGVLAFATSAAGWLRDIDRGHRRPDRSEKGP
jgi:hypothetical protein